MKTILLVMGVAAGLLVACGGDDDDDDSAGAATAAAATASSATAGPATVEVRAIDSAFEPAVIRGEPGAKVSLRITNAGQAPHNITIAAAGLNQDIAKGETKTVEVTIPVSGSTTFICAYHEAQGMVGQLVANGSQPATPSASPAARATTDSGYGY